MSYHCIEELHEFLKTLKLDIQHFEKKLFIYDINKFRIKLRQFISYHSAFEQLYFQKCFSHEKKFFLKNYLLFVCWDC